MGGVTPASAVLDLLQGSSGQDYQTRASNLLSQCKGNTYELKSPAGAKWTVGGLEDTIYKEDPEVVDGWGKVYLPKEVRMQVVGVVEETSSSCDQLVLMICETGELYAYTEEELHMVAPSLEQLCGEGMEYPSSKSYYEGEAFRNMTEDDWDEVKKSDEGKRLEEEHRKLVASVKAIFLENLEYHRQRARTTVSDPVSQCNGKTRNLKRGLGCKEAFGQGPSHTGGIKKGDKVKKLKEVMV